MESWTTYDSLRKAGSRADECYVLQTPLVNGKVTHCSERERERERESCVNMKYVFN